MSECQRCDGEIGTNSDNRPCWNRGTIQLNRACCIGDPLSGSDFLKHPSVKGANFQVIDIGWGDDRKGYPGNNNYLICQDCNDELIGIVGKFFGF